MKDNWVTVERAQLEVVAEMMRGRLEAEGVEAVLRGNAAAGAAGAINELNLSWSNPLGGVEVRVRPEDVARAREILAQDNTDPREPKRRATTPWWAQLYGVALVASVVCSFLPVFTGAQALGLVAALLVLGAGLWAWRRWRAEREGI